MNDLGFRKNQSSTKMFCFRFITCDSGTFCGCATNEWNRINATITVFINFVLIFVLSKFISIHAFVGFLSFRETTALLLLSASLSNATMPSSSIVNHHYFVDGNVCIE